MGRVIDLKGQKFGRLLVLEFAGLAENRNALWNCLCDCGNEKIIKGHLIKRGKTKSCGCLNKEITSKRGRKHKMAGTKFYQVWNTMIMRCHNPNSKSFKCYGAKGITVCDRWRVFQNFYDDMFPTYKEGLSIERKDFTKGYNPENCTWATKLEQANNTSSNHVIEYKGAKYTLSQAARLAGISVDTFKRRIYLGWDVERALNEPIRGGQKK